jgi:hypothetical protein
LNQKREVETRTAQFEVWVARAVVKRARSTEREVKGRMLKDKWSTAAWSRRYEEKKTKRRTKSHVMRSYFDLSLFGAQSAPTGWSVDCN